MNDIVQKAWTFGGPTIANIVSEKAKEAIQKQFSTSKPPAVVCINDCNFQPFANELLIPRLTFKSTKLTLDQLLLVSTT